jgi:iron complex outermembrane receptor protein
MWSGKIQLDYLPNDDALIYASVSRGVKGPGFNINLGAALSNEQTPFKGEFLYAYEVGAKLDLLDRHVRLNTSVFYYEYHDFQGYAFTGLVGTVGNYDGYFKGGEIELVVSPERNSTIRLGVAYLDSKIRDVFGAYSGLRDMESIQAPHWTVNGLAQKSFAIGPGDLSLQWSFDYLSSRYASIDNSYATRVDGSFVHNARMSYDLPDQGLQLAVFVNNISDVDRLNYSFDLIASTGSLLRTYAKPRWWGASVRKTF